MCWQANGLSPDELRGVASLLDPAALTLGFARRFATYKRADLVFQDAERLRRILRDGERPVQIVLFGGPLDGLVIRNGQADITTLRGEGYPVPRRLSPGPDGALDCQDCTCYRPRMRQGRATVLLFDDGALRRTH